MFWIPTDKQIEKQSIYIDSMENIGFISPKSGIMKITLSGCNNVNNVHGLDPLPPPAGEIKSMIQQRGLSYLYKRFKSPPPQDKFMYRTLYLIEIIMIR